VIVFGCYVVPLGQCCRGPMSVLFNIRLIPSCSSGVRAAGLSTVYSVHW
jgi:hypothetical protein